MITAGPSHRAAGERAVPASQPWCAPAAATAPCGLALVVIASLLSMDHTPHSLALTLQNAQRCPPSRCLVELAHHSIPIGERWGAV